MGTPCNSADGSGFQSCDYECPGKNILHCRRKLYPEMEVITIFAKFLLQIAKN